MQVDSLPLWMAILVIFLWIWGVTHYYYRKQKAFMAAKFADMKEGILVLHRKVDRLTKKVEILSIQINDMHNDTVGMSTTLTEIKDTVDKWEPPMVIVGSTKYRVYSN